MRKSLIRRLHIAACARHYNFNVRGRHNKAGRPRRRKLQHFPASLTNKFCTKSNNFLNADDALIRVFRCLDSGTVIIPTFRY